MAERFRFRGLLLAGCFVLAGSGFASGVQPSGLSGASGESPAGGSSVMREARAAAELPESYRYSLAVGLDNDDSMARRLIASPRMAVGPSDRQLATRLAPDLPLAWGALAMENWHRARYAAAIAAWGQAVFRISHHLEAGLWWSSTLWLISAMAWIGSSFFLILALGLRYFPRAAHDLGDLVSARTPRFARVALLSALLLLPISLGEGPLGLALGCLGIGLLYGSSRDRVMLGVAGILLVLGSDPMLRNGGRFLLALESDPVARASLGVIRGGEIPRFLARLERAAAAGDDLSERVLATRARRQGRNFEAEERFLRLVARHPEDPTALAILGNIAFAEGRSDEALALYDRARGKGDSVELMFSISQAYASLFRMAEGEVALLRAQEIDAPRVLEYLAMADAHFVADPPFPMLLIRDRMLDASDGGAIRAALIDPLAPGWLGESGFHAGAGLALMALFGFGMKDRYRQAGRCSSCHRRICIRCDSTYWSDEICSACHQLLSRPEETDSTLRKLRIAGLRKREIRAENWGRAFSFVVPGLAGLRAGRSDLAYGSLLLFFLSCCCFHWRAGVAPDPLAVGSVGTFVWSALSLVALTLYLALLLTSLLQREES